MDNIDSVVTEGNRVLRCTQDDTPLERQVWEACLKDCLDAIEQLKKTLALRMITCDSLQKRVAELEKVLVFNKSHAGDFRIFSDCNSRNCMALQAIHRDCIDALSPDKKESD